MLRPACALLVLFAVPSARAQRAAPTTPKEADILELIEVTGAVAIGGQFADQMLQSMRPMFEQAYPSVPRDVMAELLDEMRTELAAIDLAALAVPVYDRHLSAEDVRGLLKFYRTSLGQRVIASLPAILSESMAAGQAAGQEAGRRAAERVVQRLTERGYTEGG